MSNDFEVPVCPLSGGECRGDRCAWNVEVVDLGTGECAVAMIATNGRSKQLLQVPVTVINEEAYEDD